MYELLDIKPDGSEEKYWVVDKYGDRYLVKFQKKDWTNIISEHIASKFIRLLGIKAHATFLDKTNIPDKTNYDRLAVFCRDFTDEYGELKTYKETTQSIDTDMEMHDYYFEEIVYVLSKVHRVDFLKIEEDFWDMYILDLILANPDRHQGNWGLCLSGSERRLSPIFDNGASLLPHAKFINGSEEWWYDRVYVFPNSKIMFRPPIRERSNYYDTWNSGIIPSLYKDKFINMCEYISHILYYELFENEPLVPLEARYFISKLVELRYRCIVLGEDFTNVYSNLIADEVYHSN